MSFSIKDRKTAALGDALESSISRDYKPEEYFEPAEYDPSAAERGNFTNYSYWGSTVRAFLRNPVAVFFLALLVAVLAFTFIEPLLPYALIFGMEDTWTKVIGELHDARLPDTDPLAALLTAMPLSDLSASLTHNGYRSIDGTQTMMDVNHRVSDGFSNAGTALSDTFSGSNDGSGGSGWSGGGGGGGWSSGGSGGGGSSGGGMGGGGGSSW